MTPLRKPSAAGLRLEFENVSAWRDPVRSSEQEVAVLAACWQKACRNTKLGQPTITKEEFFEVLTRTSFYQRTITQTEMENKNTDVKFILEVFVGSLSTSTAEGDLFLEDEISSHSKNRTWAVPNAIHSFLSKLRPEKSFGFSDSMLCSGIRDEPQATASFFLQEGARKVVRNASQPPQKASIPDSSIARSTPLWDSPPSICWQRSSNTSRRTVDDFDQECTPEKYPHRFIFMNIMEELEVSNKSRKNDVYTRNTQELSDHA